MDECEEGDKENEVCKNLDNWNKSLPNKGKRKEFFKNLALEVENDYENEKNHKRVENMKISENQFITLID